MKILVYGAGVLGCNLARNLLRAGKDVTLLARGNWAAEIKQNGLRIKDKFSLRTSVSRIPVVTELAPDAMYDVIFVVLRYTQLDSVLDTLRANRTKNIVFVGNNVQDVYKRQVLAAIGGGQHYAVDLVGLVVQIKTGDLHLVGGMVTVGIQLHSGALYGLSLIHI